MQETDALDLDVAEPRRGYYLLFSDGNRNAPGEPMIGALLKYRRNGKWVIAPDGEISETIDSESIDEWEYGALIAGLKRARTLGVKYLRAYMDRESVVEQVNGRYKVNPALQSLHDEVSALVEGINFRLSWLPRELNLEADIAARNQPPG
jgi:ribonuclease HI